MPDILAVPTIGEATVPLVTRSRRSRPPETAPVLRSPADVAAAAVPRHDRTAGGRHAGSGASRLRTALLATAAVLVIGAIATAVIVLWFR